ncbi:hypothetical protein V5799_025272 [Amblyomma americanum]|uniref:Uncharacterized protein n=1 Tax=Amblyomma americanum TaxID=6943 RepID=A0AAQ4E9X6_AMBAM
MVCHTDDDSLRTETASCQHVLLSGWLKTPFLPLMELAPGITWNIPEAVESLKMQTIAWNWLKLAQRST